MVLLTGLVCFFFLIKRWTVPFLLLCSKWPDT
jgi:hypothetical protein